MRIRLSAWLCTAILAVVGCHKKEDPAKTEPAAEKPAPPKKLQAQPLAEAPPKAPGPEVEQCQTILDRGWKSIQPAMARLQIEEPTALEARYKKSAKNFLLRCQKLTSEQLSCLSKSENPYQDMASCKVNEGKKVSERLYAPSLRGYIKLFEPQPLPKAKGGKLLASLKGRWINNWEAARTKTTWKIDRKGKVSETSQVRQDKVRKREFNASFVQTDRMRIEWNPTSAQPFAFFKPNRKTFYATGNLAYGFYPMTNKKSFVVQNSGDYIFYDNGKCQVVSSTGLTVDGDCQFTKRKKEKIFKAKYQFPGRTMLNGKPRMDQRAYYPIGKYLLHESLVAAGKYVRK